MEKKVKLKERMAMATKANLEIGAAGFLKHYDKYRRWSGVSLLFLTIITMVLGKWTLTIIFAGLTHLTVLFNQLWWKLLNIENYYIKKNEKS